MVVLAFCLTIRDLSLASKYDNHPLFEGDFQDRVSLGKVHRLGTHQTLCKRQLLLCDVAVKSMQEDSHKTGLYQHEKWCQLEMQS